MGSLAGCGRMIKYTNNSRDLASTFCNWLACCLRIFNWKILQKCHCAECTGTAVPALSPRLPCFCFDVPFGLCASKLAVPGWPSQKFSPSGEEGQSCFLVRSQSLQGPQVWPALRLGNRVAVDNIFLSLIPRIWASSDFVCISKLSALNNVLMHFRCHEERDQKYCFFTVQRNDVVNYCC